jgi:hypothetical protein
MDFEGNQINFLGESFALITMKNSYEVEKEKAGGIHLPASFLYI